MTTRTRTRRWLRLATPFAVVVTLILISTVAYSLQQPNLGDAVFLSPDSDAPVGGSRLAGLLKQHQIAVERATRTSDALVSAARGDATLLIPAPSLVHPFYLRMLKLMPATTRVVLVAPSGRALAAGHLPVGVEDQRWAAAVREPGCALPAAQQAGPAAVLREQFTAVEPEEATLHRCYGGGLVGARWHRTELYFVGASDPFRNDRIGEHGNAALATGLLGGLRRVVWLDVHRLEPQPGYIDDPRAAGPAAPPSLGPGTPDPDFPIGDDGPDPGAPRPDRRLPAGGDGARPPNPLWTAFPTAWYASVALLLLAVVLLAFAMARRLGPPVREPLPVTVRVTETLEGRGRLYGRAKARGWALAALRTAAEQRLIRLLGLPADADRQAVTEAVAAHTGVPPDDVSAALYGPDPADDAALVQSATALDGLVEAVSPHQRPTEVEGEPR
jgi:hypothetical protein